MRSVVEAPGEATCVPGAQVVHESQETAFVVVENEPLVQDAQLWSTVKVPLAPTYWPATQTVHASHLVAGLWSWSHVPGAHAWSDAVPPAQ